jgi:hypothetical protein
MADAAIPTQEQVLADRKRKTRLGVTALCALAGAALLGSPVSAVAWAVAAVLWWGKPFGMAAMFGLALSIAVGATARPSRGADPLEKWIGKPDETLVAPSGSGGPAPVGDSTRRPPPPPAPVAAYRVVDVKDGGTIRGFVRISEAVPRWTVEHPKSVANCGKDHPTERMVHGADRGLANAVVSLEAIGAGKDWPEEMRREDRSVLVDQKRCLYVPHVQWARPETQLSVKNSDAEEHNIHGYRRTMADTQFNFASQPGSLKADVGPAYLTAPAVYLLKCDIHPWMSAYVHVTAHPYVEVTSADGAGGRRPGEFVFGDVPPGTYRVTCWHEGMGETPVPDAAGRIASVVYSPEEVQTSPPLEVKAGETSTVDFEFAAPK